ncbi:MAG: STT3 domain-containing protein [Desulfonatronovibrionaceae bacterium]
MGKKSRRKAQDKTQAEEKTGGKGGPEDSFAPAAAPQMPKPGKAAGQILMLCILVYALNLVFRLFELPGWSAPGMQFNGEYLMATHDAYAWLAGAEGINRKTGSALSGLLKLLHGIFGFKTANIGFWLPVIIAPLAALPPALLAWKKKQPEAGLVSGVMAAGCLGYLLRTRLGFLDTDIVALFFPLAIACSLVLWLSGICRREWKRDKFESAASLNPLLFLLGAVGIGLLIYGYDWFYKPQVALALAGTAFALGLVLAPVKKYRLFICGGCILFICGFGGVLGLAAGLAACGVFVYRPDFLDKWSGIGVLGAVTLILAGPDMFSALFSAVYKVLGYAKLTPAESVGNASLDLPAIAQSVREAQNVNWGAMFSRTAGGWWIFWPALAGYVYLVWKRPLFIVFLPLLGLSIASVKLGNRFAMFGGGALGIGLAFGVNRLLLDFGQSRLRRWLAQIILALLVTWPLLNVSLNLKPSPILPPAYAKTFAQVGEKAGPDAQLWQWWDYGYAGQYYAQRRVFGDGGQHGGKFLYPLARVHTTDSPLQAAQLMKFTLHAQLRQYKEMEENGTLPVQRGEAQNYPGDPVKPLREMGREKAREYVESMKNKRYSWPELPEQYLVLSWDNIRLSYWISFYGTWDLVSGNTFPGRLQRVTSDIRLDSGQGVLHLRDGRTVPLKSIDYLTEQGNQKKTWTNAGGVHAVFNTKRRELFLMDDKIYDSLMVRMLIGDPGRFEEHFELVVDNFPHNRAYRVK